MGGGIVEGEGQVRAERKGGGGLWSVEEGTYYLLMGIHPGFSLAVVVV